jgi:hypothetical protein
MGFPAAARLPHDRYRVYRLPGVLMLVIPRWALWVMLAASALGTYMLATQLWHT